jgi:D-3-phosphoglycerate dehydrogenase
VNYIIDDKDIKVEHKSEEIEDTFHSKISLDVISNDKCVNISGSLFNHSLERITSIDGFELDIAPKGNMILFKNKDIPGVVSEVSSLLFENNINISDFRMGRNDNSEALGIIVVDQSVDSIILGKLAMIEACISVDYVEM